MDAVAAALRPYSPAAVAVAIVVCLSVLGYRSALPKPIQGIPYDEDASKKILGSLPDMISYITKHGVVLPWLTGLNAKHKSPIVQFFGAPFAQPTVVLSDFQESQDILLRRTKEFDRASRSLDAFYGSLPDHHIAMRSADPRFKGNKELVRDLMSPSFLHEVSAAQIYAKSLLLIDLWSFKTRVAGGKPFEARHDIFDSALDMINAAAFAFGDDLSILKRYLDDLISKSGGGFPEGLEGSIDFPRLPFVQEIADLITVADFLGSQVISPWPLATYYYKMLTDSKLRKAMPSKDEVIKAQIKKSYERLKAGDETQHSATDFLIQREYSVARKEGREPEVFSRRNIDELFGYIVAGHETTSSTLSWGLKLIADNQDVQAKLQETLFTVFSEAKSEGRLPTTKEIIKANIPYLDAVIEEILRVGQPTPMVAREAMVDTMLLGCKIPKGTTLLVSSVGPGYHEPTIQIQDSVRSETAKAKFFGADHWDPKDRALFNPDRWLKQDEKGATVYDSQAGPFLSFGLGPRGCFGRRLAYMEMRMVLTLLLWSFKFNKLEGELASYKTIEAVTVMPKFCYVSLQQNN